MSSRSPSDPHGESPRPRRLLPRSMWAILALALFLLGLRLDDVIGGFHDREEAAYTLIAAGTGPADVPTSPAGHQLPETPPLYAWLLALLFRFTGVSVVAARLLTIGTGLGLVVATYLLGRRLVSERAGVAAALLVAVAPVAVLTGRTIGPEAPLAFFSVVAVLLYVRASSEGGTRGDAAAFAVALAIAVFTSLLAAALVPALAAWELAAGRGRRLRVLAAGAAVAAVPPLLFYALHLARDAAGPEAAVSGGSAARGLPASAWIVETIWALSPPITLCVAAGIAVALARRKAAPLLAPILLVACAAAVALMPGKGGGAFLLLPWGAIAAGAAFEGIPPAAVRRAILGIAASGAAFVALVDLSAMKLGFTEFAEFGRQAKAIAEPSYPLLVTRDMDDAHGAVVRFYDPRARLVPMDTLVRGAGGRLTLPQAPPEPFLLTFVPPQTRSAAGGALLPRARFGVEVFGRTLAEAHASPNSFRQGRYFAEKTGGPLSFGLKPLRSYPALALVPIPRGLGLWATPSGIAVRPAPFDER